jgi:hypothetical protein
VNNDSMAVTTWEDLANNVFEEIVHHLDLTSILQLCLVNRTIVHKGTQLTFRSFLRTRYVTITRSSVERFVRSTTAANSFRHLVQNVVIRAIGSYYFELEECIQEGTQYDSQHEYGTVRPKASAEQRKELQTTLDALKTLEAEDLDFGKQDNPAALLKQGFMNIAGPSGRQMQRLTFEVVVRHDDPTTACHIYNVPLPIFDRGYLIAAARTFRCTMKALSNCNLQFTEIDIFQGLPASLWCGLSYENFAMLNERQLLSHPLSSPVSLSMTLLARLAHGSDYPRHVDTNHETSAFPATGTFHRAGIPVLLASCRNLKALKVSFSCGNSQPPDLYEHEIQLVKIAHKLLGLSLPLLREVYIGGIQLSCVDISTFLLRHSAALRSLELCYVRVIYKPLSSLLSLLVGESFRLGDMRLSDVSDETNQRILFDPAGDLDFIRVSGALWGRNMIRAWGDGIRQTISYCYTTAKHPESDDLASWEEERESQFGQPYW